MRLIYTDPAERDLLGILQWISLDSPSAAEGVYIAIVAMAERLREFPNIGRRGRLAGTRELVVPSLPYVLVYQADADVITVLAVFHAARDLNAALSNRKPDPKS